jgi:hypothetical protein
MQIDGKTHRDRAALAPGATLATEQISLALERLR